MNKLLKTIFSARWIRLAGTLISTALFVWLLSTQDWPSVWLSLSQTPLWLFPLVFSMYFCAILLNAFRWYILLRAQNIIFTFGEVLKIVISGNFASNFLPSTIGGDTVRLVSTSRSAGWSVALASVVVDRLINVIAMVALLPFSWFSFLNSEIQIWSAMIRYQPYYSAGVFSMIGGNLLKNLRAKIQKIRDAFRIWQNRLDILFLALVISWTARLMIFSGIWILAGGLGMSVTLVQVIGVGVITYVLSLLPISINGFGLREVTMTTLYVQLGAPLEGAAALVIVTRFILMLETLPGALWITDLLRHRDKESDAFNPEIQ